MEKEVLGLYVTEHPLSEIRDQLRRKADTTIAELDRRRDGEIVIVGGIVTAMRQMTTKRGEAMVFLRVEDVTGGVDTVVFNSTYANARELCVDRPDPDRQGPRRPQGGRDEAASRWRWRRSRPSPRSARCGSRSTPPPSGRGIIRELAQLIQDFPGESPVFVDCVTSQGRKTYAFGPQHKVRPAPDFYAEVRMLLGESAIA